MDQINVNLDEVDDGLEPYPEGVHPMMIESAEYKPAKDADKSPYFELVLRPVPGTGDEKHKNKKLWLNLSLNPKALWNMKQLFSKLGMPMDLRGKNTGEICQMLVGQRFRPTIKIEPSNRDPEKKVNQVGPPYFPMQ